MTEYLVGSQSLRLTNRIHKPFNSLSDGNDDTDLFGPVEEFDL